MGRLVGRVGDDSVIDHLGPCGGDDKQAGAQQSLQVEPTRFPEGLDMGHEGSRGATYDSQLFGWSRHDGAPTD